MTGKVVAHELQIDRWDTYNLRIPPHERRASRRRLNEAAVAALRFVAGLGVHQHP